ncbi:MAG: hypothetical protein Q8K63_13255 [Acidimicrobiales bacterium]|nr:hypothetical protein [Acidimicrobiales bacterium]
MERAELHVSLRLAAVAFAVIGLWFGVLVPLHPNILDGPVAEAVLADGEWRLTHTAMFFVGIAGVFGGAGFVALHRNRFGRIGSLVLVATIFTGFATAGAGLLEATALPLLAKENPALIAWDGPLFSAPLFRALTGPWLLFPLCLAALGALAYRDGAHRNAGLALGASGVVFFGPGMWFVPIAGLISCVLFGAALWWWALILWRA